MQTIQKVIQRWNEKISITQFEDDQIFQKLDKFVTELQNDAGLTPEEVGAYLMAKIKECADFTADHENDLINSGEATEDEF